MCPKYICHQFHQFPLHPLKALHVVTAYPWYKSEKYLFLLEFFTDMGSEWSQDKIYASISVQICLLGAFVTKIDA